MKAGKVDVTDAILFGSPFFWNLNIDAARRTKELCRSGFCRESLEGHVERFNHAAGDWEPNNRSL